MNFIVGFDKHRSWHTNLEEGSHVTCTKEEFQQLIHIGKV